MFVVKSVPVILLLGFKLIGVVVLIPVPTFTILESIGLARLTPLAYTSILNNVPAGTETGSPLLCLVISKVRVLPPTGGGSSVANLASALLLGLPVVLAFKFVTGVEVAGLPP